MSNLKAMIQFSRYGRTYYGFKTLPVKWPNRSPPKVTSSAARDNAHRFTKEFTGLMEYGVGIRQHEDTWRFVCPDGRNVQFDNRMPTDFYTIINLEHYATFRPRLAKPHTNGKKIRVVRDGL